MSRRKSDMTGATELGTVYTLHLDPPLGHARHYTGWTADLESRLAAHRAGHGGRANGARLLQVQHQRGGTFRLAAAEHGVTRDREIQLKQRGATRRCPICKNNDQEMR